MGAVTKCVENTTFDQKEWVLQAKLYIKKL